MYYFTLIVLLKSVVEV